MLEMQAARIDRICLAPWLLSPELLSVVTALPSLTFISFRTPWEKGISYSELVRRLIDRLVE